MRGSAMNKNHNAILVNYTVFALCYIFLSWAKLEKLLNEL